MDELLKIYLPKTESQRKEIWNKAILVFDTNVLLNLYKYSNGTRNEFMTIMERAIDRLWLPHQVALEFLLNRREKIKDQELEYNNHIKAIRDAQGAAIEVIDKGINGIKKPFRKMDLGELKEKVENFFEGPVENLNNENKEKPDFNEEDMVLNNFISFYSDKIGKPYTRTELEEIYSIGKERYQKEQPPGYADWKSKEGEHKYFKDTSIKSEYGDLILWMQTIQKAKDDNAHVVFVTDDSKEDWWKEYKGIKTPRQELLNEFKAETGKEVLIYNSEQFLRNANMITQQNPNTNAINEIRAVSKYFNSQDYKEKEMQYKEIPYDVESLTSLKFSIRLNKKKIGKLEHEIELLHRENYMIEDKLNEYSFDSEFSDQHKEQIVSLRKSRRKVRNLIHKLHREKIDLLYENESLMKSIENFEDWSIVE